MTFSDIEDKDTSLNCDNSGKQIFYKFLKDNFSDNTLIDKFERLTKLYFEINSVINISAIRTENDVYIKHYLDSLIQYDYFAGECCDVGCGGGFPCLPLAIVTGLNFTAIDSVRKKLTLINRCKSELDLNNITPMHIRSEDLAKSGARFDTVCARALADSDKSIEYCAPLTRPGGKIILYKTPDAYPACERIEREYDVIFDELIDYTLTGTDIKRCLYIYIKK